MESVLMYFCETFSKITENSEKEKKKHSKDLHKCVRSEKIISRPDCQSKF